jgi:6-phospho-3-hexuloisomerase
MVDTYLKTKTVVGLVADEVNTAITNLDSVSLDLAVDLIQRTHRKFALGLGRGGLMLKAFEMRLFHLGFESYGVWGINTPPIQENDLLIIVSNSGNTETTLALAKKAKSHGSKILLFTTNNESELGRMSDVVIEIKAPGMKKSNTHNNSQQLMNSLFEQTVLITGDILTLCLKSKLKMLDADIESRHANLE